MLDGQQFTAINGGPELTFDEAVSFVTECADQDAVDYYWEKLGEGGQEVQCGWLKDRYGLSWQVVPADLVDLLRIPRRVRLPVGLRPSDVTSRSNRAVLGRFEIAGVRALRPRQPETDHHLGHSPRERPPGSLVVRR